MQPHLSCLPATTTLRKSGLWNSPLASAAHVAEIAITPFDRSKQEPTDFLPCCRARTFDHDL
jgi:hypothetical protein